MDVEARIDLSPTDLDGVDVTLPKTVPVKDHLGREGQIIGRVTDLEYDEGEGVIQADATLDDDIDLAKGKYTMELTFVSEEDSDEWRVQGAFLRASLLTSNMVRTDDGKDKL